MWKCLHRGVLGSANVLKADQPNGACIISTLVSKDLEDLTSQPNVRNKCTCNTNGGFANNPNAGKHKLNTKKHSLIKRRTENVKSVAAQPCKSFPLKAHDLCHPNTVTSSVAVKENHNDTIKLIGACSTTIETCDSNFKSKILCSSPKCSKGSEGEQRCFCSFKTCLSPLISNKISANNQINKTFQNPSINSVISESNCPDFGLAEENTPNPNLPLVVNKKNSSLPVDIRISPSHISFLPPNLASKEGKQLQLPSYHESFSSKKSQSHAKTYCLLKLPFLSYNIGSLKGFGRFSACWLSKSQNEFGRDGNRGQGSGYKKESEESKKDHWKHFQIHHSLLEAIGWSSAILLGWFLGQCRINCLRGERHHHAERKAKGERKRCIARVVSRLLFSWKNENFPSLAVFPNGMRKEESCGSTKESKFQVEPCNGGSEGYFSDTAIKVNDTEQDAFLDTCGVSCESSEISEKSKKYLNFQQEEPHNAKKEMGAIPMPWYSESQNECFGPITLDDAIKEAEKGLEQAQAEVLLSLALKKLDEGENTSHYGPSVVELLDSAAQLGSPAAAFNLGICYEMGVGGVTKDLTKAYSWYKKASDNGHAAATYNLAVFHAQGLADLIPDTILAHQLLERASLLGQPEAADALILLTSLKPTRCHNNNSIQDTRLIQEQNGHQVVHSYNSRSETSCSIVNVQEAVRTSETFYSDNGNNYSNSDHSSQETNFSSSSWYKDTSLKLDHLMESFSVPFGVLDDKDVLFDSAQNDRRKVMEYDSMKV